MIDEGPSPEDIERFGGDDDYDEDVITCPSCGAEVWHEVSVCPKCRIPIGVHSGRQSPQQKYFQDRTTVLVIVLVIVGLIISYLVCGAIF